MNFHLSKRKTILCLFLLFLSCLALAACSKTFLPEEHGFTALVVYDANGGSFGTSDTTGIKTYKYKPSVSIMEPGGKHNLQFNAPSMSSKHVIAWFPALLDENGAPLKNEDGSFQLADEPWDFSADRLPDEAGYKLYLVAKWGMNYKLTIDVGEEARKAGVENIVNQSFTEAGPISQPGLNPEWNGYTFHYYYTEDGKRLRTSEDWAQLVLNDETPELTIYVRWLTGKWYIVTSADGLSDMGQRNYILDADIDMGGREFKTPTNYQGTFDGNGHTIPNFETSVRQGGQVSSVGLFSFAGRGCVKNVTFADATLAVTLTSRLTGVGARFNVGFFCGNGEALDLENFVGLGFRNCVLNVKREVAAVEMPVKTGESTHFGIFGTLKSEQNFTPVAGSTAVSVTVE